MKAVVVAWFLSIASQCIGMEWRWESGSRVSEPSVGYIACRDSGSEDFDAVVAQHLAKDLSIIHIYLAREWVKDAELQEELASTLLTVAPKEFEAARRSSGGWNNPAVISLRPAFRSALLESKLARSLDASLSKHGLTIVCVSCEKFSVDRTDGSSRLDAIVWLRVEKKTTNKKGCSGDEERIYDYIDG